MSESLSHSTYIFEAVQVLITLAADITLIWLLLLHPERAWIWRRSLRVNNGESTVAVLMKLLGLMAMSLVVPGDLVSKHNEWSTRCQTYLRPFWFL